MPFTHIGGVTGKAGTMAMQQKIGKLRKHITELEQVVVERNRRIKQLKDENKKLRELCTRFVEYVSQDRCEGCVVKSRCNDDEVEECWQRTEIRELARGFGIEVD